MLSTPSEETPLASSVAPPAALTTAQAASQPHYREVSVPCGDSAELFCRVWETPANSAPRNLLIVHGACEHGGKYLGLAEKANRAGWRVLLPDLRAHGRSTGSYVHVQKFEHYLQDLQHLQQEFSFSPAETTLLGCSMGGLISIRFNQWSQRQAGQPGCQQLFLISPLLAIKHPIARWKKVVAGLLGHYFPRTRFRSTINPADLTHNKKVLEQRTHDRLIRKQVTARWFLEVEQAMSQAFAEIPQFQVPTWIYQAGEDRIVDPAATLDWAERVNRAQQSSLVQAELLAGWYHEILKETDGKQMEDRLLTQMQSVWESGRTQA